MRIAYGVHGYGRGHAARALAVSSELARRHELSVFAGGDAYDALSGELPCRRIPVLSHQYLRGRRSNLRTVAHNAGTLLDLLRRGPGYRAVLEALAAFGPDLVICDAEGWTHRAARELGVPRVSFDHFGMMAYCDLPVTGLDRVKVRLEGLAYRRLIGAPEYALVSSFFEAPLRDDSVRIVAPPLRREVYDFEAEAGEHLLVYFNRGRHQLTPRVLSALADLDREVRIYGVGSWGQVGNLSFRAPGNRPFLADLSSAAAVLSTAGNQLVAEGMHYGKAMLVCPETTVEQRMNGAALAASGYGEVLDFDLLTAGRIEQFLERAPMYAARARRAARDGRAEAVAAIEGWLAALGGRSAASLEEAA